MGWTALAQGVRGEVVVELSLTALPRGWHHHWRGQSEGARGRKAEPWAHTQVCSDARVKEVGR